nr:MAG TPA: hypothetical protein [Caudoviricetes sp.]
MARIEISREDCKRLLRWRDGHKEQVRSYVPAFDFSIIVVSDDEDGLHTIIRAEENDRLFTVLFRISIGGDLMLKFLWHRISQKVDVFLSKLPEREKEENIQSVVSVYASIMAYMNEKRPVEYVSFNKEILPKKECAKKARSQNSEIIVVKNSSPIRKNINNQPSKRAYTKPTKAVNVRGFVRHYKNGKVVYIKPFIRYSNCFEPIKNKTYKIVV